MYKCDECGKEFEKRQSYAAHKSSHKRGESYSKKRRSKDDEYYIKKEALKNAVLSTCKFCGENFDKKKIGAHVIFCNSNNKRDLTKKKISESNKNRQVSDEVKKKISESMKKAHSDNRAWNIGKSRWNNKKSYPEEFFEKVIENEFDDKIFVNEHPVDRYSLDFAWIHKMKAIEIDGEQHERFEEYRERDKRKDEACKKLGWTILRISWKDLYHNPKDFIKIANEFIGQVV